MAEQQVLLCPVCGKSGALGQFGIDPETGGALQERREYVPQIGLKHRNKVNGQVYWTHHEAPVHVLISLRQQLTETLIRLDSMIQEAMDESGE